MSDSLAAGRRIRVLTLLDTFARECVALELGGGLGGTYVARVLMRPGLQRRLPAATYKDIGIEFLAFGRTSAVGATA